MLVCFKFKNQISVYNMKCTRASHSYITSASILGRTPHGENLSLSANIALQSFMLEKVLFLVLFIHIGLTFGLLFR